LSTAGALFAGAPYRKISATVLIALDVPPLSHHAGSLPRTRGSDDEDLPERKCTFDTAGAEHTGGVAGMRTMNWNEVECEALLY
jgi:hypothetical protein